MGDSCRQLGFIVNHCALTFSENSPAAQSAASHKIKTLSPLALSILRCLTEISHVWHEGKGGGKASGVKGCKPNMKYSKLDQRPNPCDW